MVGREGGRRPFVVVVICDSIGCHQVGRTGMVPDPPLTARCSMVCSSSSSCLFPSRLVLRRRSLGAPRVPSPSRLPRPIVCDDDDDVDASSR